MKVLNLTDIIFAGLLIIVTLAYVASLIIDHLNSKQRKRKRTERDKNLRTRRTLIIVGTLISLSTGIICVFNGMPVVVAIFTVLLMTLAITDVTTTINKDHH